MIRWPVLAFVVAFCAPLPSAAQTIERTFSLGAYQDEKVDLPVDATIAYSGEVVVIRKPKALPTAAGFGVMLETVDRTHVAGFSLRFMRLSTGDYSVNPRAFEWADNGVEKEDIWNLDSAPLVISHGEAVPFQFRFRDHTLTVEVGSARIEQVLGFTPDRVYARPYGGDGRFSLTPIVQADGE